MEFTVMWTHVEQPRWAMKYIFPVFPADLIMCPAKLFLVNSKQHFHRNVRLTYTICHMKCISLPCTCISEIKLMFGTWPLTSFHSLK